MADDSGRLNDILAETAFLYGANAAFVEDLQAKWAADPASVAPSWREFFATLADSPDAVRQAESPPTWTPEVPAAARPDWLSAIDGLWPAAEAKLGQKIPPSPLAPVRMRSAPEPWIPCAPS
jgi:2-oxoglutarate dehydrogenase E1 component